jgi:spore germination cell wall hydrolase CwlJ-like protein
MGLVGPIASWARPGHSVAGVVASLVLSVLGWPLLTAGAQGPGLDVHIPAPAHADIASATLVRQGDDLIITGSVAMLFNTGSFSGPNRAEKTNRSRLTPDGITVSAGFDAIRTRLAEMRTPKPNSGSSTVPMGLPTSSGGIRVAEVHPDGTFVTSPVEATVASVSDNPAVTAIDQIVPMAAPTPMTATPQLAYARETEPATTAELGIDKFGGKVSKKDVNCMAEAVYFEARGESYRGQVAVGQVVMNRLAHKIYPKDICQVVFQNQQMHNACQFSFACDGIPETINDSKSWAQANEIAKGVINGTLYLPEVGKATHYHANYVYPDWAPRLKRVAKIGHHIFYQFKRSA